MNLLTKQLYRNYLLLGKERMSCRKFSTLVELDVVRL